MNSFSFSVLSNYYIRQVVKYKNGVIFPVAQIGTDTVWSYYDGSDTSFFCKLPCNRQLISISDDGTYILTDNNVFYKYNPADSTEKLLLDFSNNITVYAVDKAPDDNRLVMLGIKNNVKEWRMYVLNCDTYEKSHVFTTDFYLRYILHTLPDTPYDVKVFYGFA